MKIYSTNNHPNITQARKQAMFGSITQKDRVAALYHDTNSPAPSISYSPIIVSRETGEKLSTTITQIHRKNECTIKLSHKDQTLGRIVLEIPSKQPSRNSYLNILELISHHKDTVRGTGTALLDLAVIESIKLGYDGRLSLTAANDMVREQYRQSPLKFYLGYGFKGSNPHEEMTIQKIIKEHQRTKRPIPNIAYQMRLPFLSHLRIRTRILA